MKKLIITLALIAAAVSANAQVGIIAGVSTTNNDMKDAYENYSAINQYHVGVTAKIPLFLGLAIQPSVIYDVKGATIKEFGSGEVVSGQSFSETGYLEIPIQLQWGIDIAGIARPYVFAEPFVGYSLTMKRMKLANINVGELIDLSAKSDWENVDLQADKFDKSRMIYGCGVGAGVEVFKHFQLSARYVWNMGALYNEDGKTNFTSLKDSIDSMKAESSNGIRVSLAIMF